MAKQPIKYFVVDAFTDSAFKGNPAAVCFLEEERDEEWLRSLAAEFNIAITCYLTRISESDIHLESINNGSMVPRFRLRWFSPAAEEITKRDIILVWKYQKMIQKHKNHFMAQIVGLLKFKLCGHATLAASHAIFSSGLVNSNTIEFITLSGILTAKKVPQDKKSETFFIELNFPALQATVYDSVEVSSIYKALKDSSEIESKPKKTTTGNDLIIELPSGKNVVDFEPNMDELKKCPGRGVIITGAASPASEFDFFSRAFFPKFGIPEDAVCGSAHCALALYWSKKLGKNDFVAYAASPRGGIVNLHLDEQNQRVLLQGKALTVMEGSILV